MNHTHLSFALIVTDEHIMLLMYIVGQQEDIATTSVLGALRILDNPGSGKHSTVQYSTFLLRFDRSTYVLYTRRKKNKRLGY
jgi:hypothetical protein